MTSAPLFHGKILTFARTLLISERCARIFCLILPISPEKRETTSYCRTSLCLLISRILAKPINFDSEVRPMVSESHILLTVSTLRQFQVNQGYVKIREKQHTEQQHINTSQFRNYLTSHYSVMKNAENGRLIYDNKRCSYPLS